MKRHAATRQPGAVAAERMPAVKSSAPDGMNDEWPVALMDHKQALGEQEAEWRRRLFKAELRVAELEKKLAEWSGITPSDLAHELLRGRVIGKRDALAESAKLETAIADAARQAAVDAAETAATKSVELFRDAVTRERADEELEHWADEVLREDARKRTAPFHRLLDHEEARRRDPSLPRPSRAMEKAASASLHLNEGTKVRDTAGRITGVALHDGTLVEVKRDPNGNALLPGAGQ